MSNPIFPTNLPGQDSKLYSVEHEDTSMKTKMDGGYVVSRAKHTRKPRKTFTTGLTMLRSSEKATLEAFYETVNCSVIFDWTDTSSGIVYQVRMVEPLSFKYVGIANSQFWDTTFKLEQA